MTTTQKSADPKPAPKVGPLLSALIGKTHYILALSFV